ncbi:arginine--tRNA ligase [Candidatus Micrarchaeota archaeon]|nr:arginine--tRNA ligase [Candidatus Micrarchaeota archaeon]
MYALKDAKTKLEKAVDAPVETPKNPDLADLSIPCFALAKTRKKAPQDIAQDIASKTLPPEFQSVKASGPYANVLFSDAFYARVLEESAAPNYGTQTPQKGRWVLEYSQPNPGKPMHLGHIRSTIVGDVCANALDWTGKDVVRLNYLNDRGAHIAELIVAIEEFKDLPKVRDEKDLLEYYVKIKKEIDSNDALKEKSRNVLEHIQDHQKQLTEIRELSLKAFKKNYDALDVSFDEYPLETALENDARKCVKEALQKGLAKKEPDDTTIAVLEPFGLPNTVLLRSNDTPVYLTSDLALADWKWQKYAFAQSWVITASEQNLHFRQLQTLLKEMGRKYAEDYHHKGFGLIRLAEGKMSTRQGRVILLEDVIQEVVAEAERQVREKSQSGNPKQTAKAVGIAALKYGVLKVRLEKDITFDPKAEVQFEGDTSAYIQYAHVRAASILEKYAREKSGKQNKPNPKTRETKTKNPKDKQSGVLLPKPSKKLDLNQSEKNLLKKLAEFPEAVTYTAETLQPHALCEYALSVAKAFTQFYGASPVLSASDSLKTQRLHIASNTKNVLSICLKLLGIEALEKM